MKQSLVRIILCAVMVISLFSGVCTAQEIPGTFVVLNAEGEEILLSIFSGYALSTDLGQGVYVLKEATEQLDGTFKVEKVVVEEYAPAIIVFDSNAQDPYYERSMAVEELEQISTDIPGTHYALSREREIIKVTDLNISIISTQLTEGVYVLLEGAKEEGTTPLQSESVKVGKVAVVEYASAIITHNVNEDQPYEQSMPIDELEQIAADVLGTHYALSTAREIIKVTDLSNNVLSTQLNEGMYVLLAGTKALSIDPLLSESVKIGKIIADEFGPGVLVHVVDEENTYSYEQSLPISELEQIGTDIECTHYALSRDLEIIKVTDYSGNVISAQLTDSLYALREGKKEQASTPLLSETVEVGGLKVEIYGPGIFVHEDSPAAMYEQYMGLGELWEIAADIPRTHYTISRDLELIKISNDTEKMISTEIADGVYVLLDTNMEPSGNEFMDQFPEVGKVFAPDLNNPQIMVYDTNMEGPYYIQPLEIYNLEQMSADIPGTHYALSRDLDIIKVSAQSANVVSQEIADGVYVLLQGTKEPHENALLAEAVIVGKMITDDNDPEFLVYDVNTQEPDREHMFEIYDLEQITADIPGTHLGLSTNLNIVTVKDQSNDIVTWEIANNIYVLRSGTKQDNEQISIGTVKVDEYSPEIVFLYDEVLLQEISMTAEELSFINTGLVNTHWGLITDYNEIMLLSNDSGDILAGKINNYLHVLLPATELPDGRIQAGDSIFDTSDHELKITVFNEQMSAEEDLWEGEIGALLYDTQNAGISINLNMLNESPVITQGPVMTPELVTAGDNAQLIIAVMDEGQLIGCEWIPEVGTVEGDTYYVDKSCPADAYYMIAQADDNNGGMAFAFIRIGVLPYVNIAPVIAPIEGKQVYETNNLSFAVDGSDADGDSLTYNAQNLPDGAQLSADGVFGWTPQINQAGSYTVTFIANDGQADSNSEEVTINVLILGDMNADGTVDLSDLKLFKTAYRSLDPAADLNNDGILTNADYKILKENLGRSI